MLKSCPQYKEKRRDSEIRVGVAVSGRCGRWVLPCDEVGCEPIRFVDVTPGLQGLNEVQEMRRDHGDQGLRAVEKRTEVALRVCKLSGLVRIRTRSQCPNVLMIQVR